ncbi:MAG TPA: transposase [Steroidobacter sp.]
MDEVVRSSVEETLNALLDAEADAICRAQRYECSPDRVDTRAGHYERKLEAKAGEVRLKIPKLRRLPFCSSALRRNTLLQAPYRYPSARAERNHANKHYDHTYAKPYDMGHALFSGASTY